MNRNAMTKLVAALALFGVGMYAGYTLKTFLYNDACLDMGGGMNPGGEKICVVER